MKKIPTSVNNKKLAKLKIYIKKSASTYIDYIRAFWIPFITIGTIDYIIKNDVDYDKEFKNSKILLQKDLPVSPVER